MYSTHHYQYYSVLQTPSADDIWVFGGNGNDQIRNHHIERRLFSCSRFHVLNWKELSFKAIVIGINILLWQASRELKCEDNVYKAAINWLKHDVEERKVHLPELLNHIRLPLISTQFLRSHVAAEPLLTQDLKCYKLLADALFEKLMPVEEGKCSSDRSQIRKGIEYNKEIFHVFLVGGIMHNKSKVYDISKNKLIQISNMNEIRSQHSAIGLNGVVYSMGGYNDSRLRTAECYDPVNKRWNYIAPMSNSRYNFGICSYNDFVYVVGGYDTSTVECYNPASNEWRSCPNIPNGSSYYTRATLVENSIYSLDNYNSASCLRFDPREQRWYEMNMKTNTSYGFELVSYGRTLFCINTDSCKRLDVRMNTWESMPSMHIKRKYFSAVIAADNIYVLGGDGVKRVERYNISNNEWTTIDWIETEHYRGAAAVVDGDFKF
uniref:BACK domain-containing protein n=1 Tax=Glossina brevipalpis TaxID=37001 RepID=A0A1A9WXW3_9MUSC